MAVPIEIDDQRRRQINAITVPREHFAEFEERFASRAGKVIGTASELWSFDLLERKDG